MNSKAVMLIVGVVLCSLGFKQLLKAEMPVIPVNKLNDPSAQAAAQASAVFDDHLTADEKYALKRILGDEELPLEKTVKENGIEVTERDVYINSAIEPAYYSCNGVTVLDPKTDGIDPSLCKRFPPRLAVHRQTTRTSTVTDKDWYIAIGTKNGAILGSGIGSAAYFLLMWLLPAVLKLNVVASLLLSYGAFGVLIGLGALLGWAWAKATADSTNVETKEYWRDIPLSAPPNS